MNIIRLFIKQIKAHPVTVMFFIIGFFISTLIISIGLSNIINVRNSIIEKNNGIYKDSLNINVSLSKGIKFDDFIDSFNNISNKSKVRINNISTYVNNKSTQYEIVAEYSKSDEISNFPIMKGRYYNSREILNKEKVAVIGKQLESSSYKNNGIQKIKLGNEEYKVIGVIGHNLKSSAWDKTIFIPITSIPDNSKIDYFKMRSSDLLLISENGMEASDLKSIDNNLKKLDPDSSTKASRAEESKNVLLDTIGSNDQILKIAGLILIFSIVNMISISSFWINERKQEIGIKKSFGITDFQISVTLFIEFMSITLITALLSLSFQFILSLFTENIFGCHLALSIPNFISAILISISSALVTVIVPSIKAIKVSPIEALNM
ncbi:ABC transporter permease [Inconstantimicrobium porci]|nr:ABC transporter permease [Inconstantimicrobium porci]